MVHTCPCHKRSALSCVRVSCLQGHALPQGIPDHRGTKGWPLLRGDKFCGTVVAQSVPCGAWLKPGYSSSLLSFSPQSDILLSQLSFSREHSFNKPLPQESWRRLCFSENRPKTGQLDKMRLSYVISSIPFLSFSSLPANIHIFHIFVFFFFKSKSSLRKRSDSFSLIHIYDV